MLDEGTSVFESFCAQLDALSIVTVLDKDNTEVARPEGIFKKQVVAFVVGDGWKKWARVFPLLAFASKPNENVLVEPSIKYRLIEGEIADVQQIRVEFPEDQPELGNTAWTTAMNTLFRGLGFPIR